MRDLGFREKFIDEKGTDERNVIVSAIRADWLLREDVGIKFQTSLSEIDDMALFDMQSIQTVVFF